MVFVFGELNITCMKKLLAKSTTLLSFIAVVMHLIYSYYYESLPSYFFVIAWVFTMLGILGAWFKMSREVNYIFGKEMTNYEYTWVDIKPRQLEQEEDLSDFIYKRPISFFHPHILSKLNEIDINSHKIWFATEWRRWRNGKNTECIIYILGTEKILRICARRKEPVKYL